VEWALRANERGNGENDRVLNQSLVEYIYAAIIGVTEKRKASSPPGKKKKKDWANASRRKIKKRKGRPFCRTFSLLGEGGILPVATFRGLGKEGARMPHRQSPFATTRKKKKKRGGKRTFEFDAFPFSPKKKRRKEKGKKTRGSTS